MLKTPRRLEATEPNRAMGAFALTAPSSELSSAAASRDELKQVPQSPDNVLTYEMSNTKPKSQSFYETKRGDSHKGTWLWDQPAADQKWQQEVAPQLLSHCTQSQSRSRLILTKFHARMIIVNAMGNG